MANEEQLEILKQGVEVWNQWRAENSTIDVDLQNADLSYAKLGGVYLRDAHLRGADLIEANLVKADLWEADLWEANLHGHKNLHLSVRDDAQEGQTRHHALPFQISLLNVYLHRHVRRTTSADHASLQKYKTKIAFSISIAKGRAFGCRVSGVGNYSFKRSQWQAE